jgi:D-alanyl-D-alanine carboxypeptidase
VTRLLASAIVMGLATAAGFHSTSQPLSAQVRQDVIAAHEWHPGCPVPLSQLRVLTVSYLGFDGRTHQGQLVVNENAVAPLTQVFRRLYAMHFPVRHMQLSDTYGPVSGQPPDQDVTASFECRQASSSPCTGTANTGNGNWSEHAYGEAVDLNPVENPYVGCGVTRDSSSEPFLDRNRIRRGMVTAAVVDAFRSVGWGWGGAWTGSTQDYMHFSATGH